MTPKEIGAIGMAIVVGKIINLHFMNKNITKRCKDKRLSIPWNNKNP